MGCYNSKSNRKSDPNNDTPSYSGKSKHSQDLIPILDSFPKKLEYFTSVEFCQNLIRG